MLDDPTVQTALMTFLLALLGLLTAAIAAITPKIRTWLDAETTKAEANGYERQVAVAKELAGAAVAWAEQELSGARGDAKKQAATAWLWKLANERGIGLPMSDAEKLVEAAVKGMNDVSVSLDVSAPATVQPTATTANRKRGADGRFLPKEDLVRAERDALRTEMRERGYT
jgi:hypothetical protein